MATTHALAGVALATVTLLVAPEHAPVAITAAAIGGIFPDLDLYGSHRRHLHYPILYSILALPAAAILAAAPSVATVAMATFLGAAALHSSMDVLGGGLELEPWRGESERAVYDHVRRRWVAPRRWIRYDGAPEDLALAAVCALPPLFAFGPIVEPFVVGTLLVSIGYTLVRKRLVDIWIGILASLPADLRRRITERFLEDYSDPPLDG